MDKRDSLGDRMKNYENVTRNYLVRRTPVIIRLDGKAFHSFTKGFTRPFDSVLMYSIQDTMLYLCKHIQGCVMGYCQSDEISLLLVDYQDIDTCAWFDNNILKLVSVSASMATLSFNSYFKQNNETERYVLDEDEEEENNINSKRILRYDTAIFDSRAFNIPKEEVCNYFIWRQNDATRNSIQMVGQSKFSHRQLQGVNTSKIQEMLFQEYEINWSKDFSTSEKRGSCCIKENGSWKVDYDIPIFTQDRGYIERYVYLKDDKNG